MFLGDHADGRQLHGIGLAVGPSHCDKRENPKGAQGLGSDPKPLQSLQSRFVLYPRFGSQFRYGFLSRKLLLKLTDELLIQIRKKCILQGTASIVKSVGIGHKSITSFNFTGQKASRYAGT
jgi:hypothetical protein